jgi:ABC-type dipeptide/oligopeptide/nickel transport system permease component
MNRYVLARISTVPLWLVAACTLIFVLTRIAPGDPSSLYMSPGMTADDRDRIIAKHGLDRPLAEQYFRWMYRLVRGDMGISYSYHLPCAQVIRLRIVPTLELQIIALALSLAVAVPLGVYIARRPDSWVRPLAEMCSVFGIAMPRFWLCILLILIFGVALGILPVVGNGAGLPTVRRIPYFVMPTAVLVIHHVGYFVPYVRGTMFEQLRADYVTTARSKGLRERQVLLRHAFRNTLIAIATMVGLFLPDLVGGSVIVETIFSWPGMGRLAMDAAMRRDYPLIMATSIVIGAVVIFANLAVDLAYAWLDPRIRLD